MLGIEGRGPAGHAIGSGFRRQLAQRIRRRAELVRPMFVVAEFIEKPMADAVLFLGRQGRQFRDGGVQGLGHKEKNNRTERGGPTRAVPDGRRCDRERPLVSADIGPTKRRTKPGAGKIGTSG